jgi:hypothetical protein
MRTLRTSFAALLMCVSAFGLDSIVSAAPLSAAPPDAELVAAKGGDRIAIRFDDKHLAVDGGSVHVVGTANAGKRFYRNNADGAAVAEVKPGDDGFKLRASDEKLLWKVKIAADKIKIADNEEMQHAWTIKIHADHSKVSNPKDVEIGGVKANAETGKIKVKDAADHDVYVVETGKLLSAYGVVLMKDIPEPYRDVIMAELFMRGR